MSIRISVALVTRNGPDRLRRTLACVREQTFPPHEIIVSDDSDPAHTTATREVAQEFGAHYVEGPHRGLYANRNATAVRCTGTHIRTMDDDHEFDPDHFALCASAIATETEAVWTTGEQGYVDGKPVGREEFATQLHPCGLGSRPVNPDDNWAIADGSTFYPASVFQRGYRMLETFGYGSSFLEFGAYLRRRGYRCRAIRGAIIRHYMDAAVVERHEAFSRSRAESCLYASLAFNLYFQPNALRAARYTLSTLLANRKDPSLLLVIPSILRSLQARWDAP